MQLNRFNRLRAIEISADLAPGYTMGEAVKWFQDTVREKLPPEATLMLDGESGEYLRSGQQLYFTFLFALAIVFLVLAAQFESFVHPAIIMVTVPLALLGAVFGLKLYGLEHQHLQPDRRDHADRHRRQERRADRGVREPAARPRRRVHRGRREGRRRRACVPC